MTEPVPQPPAKKRLRLAPQPGGRLEQFLMANKDAHDKAGAAEEAETEAKKAVKAFLLDIIAGLPSQVRPEAVDIPADAHGRYPGYTLTLKGGKRLDTEVFRTEQADMYERYSKPVTPSWELREITSPAKRGRR